MHVIEALQERRSVKYFDPTHCVSEAEQKRLIELAMLSPTAFNLQHWRFVVLRDPALRQAVRAQSWDQPQVTDATLLIVVCADLNAWRGDTRQYWVSAPKAVQEMIVPSIVAYYQNRPSVQRDEAMRSGGIAAQSLMLAAKSMGYDSCPMVGFDFEAVGKLINLPQDHVITMFVAIGKATQAPWPRGGQIDYDRVALIDRFPDGCSHHPEEIR
ncbi:nitroreductase family protein [Burkholderia ubonensis]|uniref:nitroreductase family protein n=1 Tax=Burkholderia ubonensis TaxID=101571 RepID=UPI000759AB8F|nr:nitroreductase family protein [Burkholderia ubonensis]KVD73045.1 hypothetical protein WI88_28550 [Burkholderia ubonensis]